MDNNFFALHSIRQASFMLLLCLYHLFTVHCQEESTMGHNTSSSSSSGILVRIVVSILFGFLAGIVGAILVSLLLRCFIQYMKRTPILKGPVIFTPKITANTLQSALANGNQLLGNGKYQRAVLDNGLAIAVKRLDSAERQNKSMIRHIQQELEMLAGLKHRNLMSLRAFIWEPNKLSLVYDYMPNGSLEDAMNNQLQQLNWEIRLRIAVGVIKGLRYLHFECNPRVHHYNLKPANVMLDAEFEPRLADCGLAKLMPNMMNREAAAGYCAPECFPEDCSSRYSDKSDVFSFGMILGVLLTGRDSMDPLWSGEAGGGGSMGRWLRQLQQAGEAREAIDKSILGGDEAEEDEMLMALRIAVVCLSDLPADRPSSDELVPMLTQLHSF